jgi:hypothetical protein
MKRLHRSLFVSLALLVAFAATGMHAQRPIGFLEKFALSADRDTVLKELIPGTEDYYFFHALHLQNNGRHAELATLLGQWAKRSPESSLLREIRNREALLAYDTDPQGTLEYLKRALNVTFDHQQDTLHPRPNLPTALDPRQIAFAEFQKQALRDPYSLDGSRVTDEGIEYLLANKIPLSLQQRRVLLSRVTRPDTPNLVEAILADMKRPDSRGFGEFEIEKQLLLTQLEQIRKARPEVMKFTSFVYAWLARLRPGADTNPERDAKAREAWLEAMWVFAKDLYPTFNSLKAHILYLRLEHDEKIGNPNQERFLEYLKLPRQAPYVSHEYRDNSAAFRYPVNLGEDFSSTTGHPPVRNDEALVRRYLLRFLKDKPDREAFAPYVEATYLKKVQAEAKLMGGVGDAETWFSQLTPAEVQALRDRVDIDFDLTNAETFAPDAPVTLTLQIKNVPHLAVNIFEINTENFHRTTQEQIGTDLDLDGLVANKHLGFDYTEAPVLRVPRTFKLTDIPARRGVWVVDFIGNGRSSRALIRKGQLDYVTRSSSAGTALMVLDENRLPLSKAYVLFGGQRFSANKDSEIIIPFSNAAGRQAVILGDGEGFTQLEHIVLEGENYALTAGFHVPHESLLSGKKATLAVRPTLTMNGSPVDLRLLEEVKLTILSTTQDGVNSSSVKDKLKLTEGKEITAEFNVPERLKGLHFTLECQVRHVLTGAKTPLSASSHMELNQLDVTEVTSDVFLSSVAGEYELQELGRTGEPRSERAVNLKLWRAEFAQPVELSLKTDAAGGVHLGPLEGIEHFSATLASGVTHTWYLPEDQATAPGNIHLAADQSVALPWLDGDAKPVPPLVSLIEQRSGANVRSLTDQKHINVRGAFLVLGNLDPGDYNLRYGRQHRTVNIRVTRGKEIAGWVIGEARHLQVRPLTPLQVGGVSVGNESLTVLLENATPDTRVHVLASRFVPTFSIFSDLGSPPGTEPLVGTPGSLQSLFLSGRTLGEEYRYVLERRGAPKYPGVMLPRPGLLLNPWVLRVTETARSEAQLGDEFRRAEDGRSAGMAAPKAPPQPIMPRYAPRAIEAISDVDFLANPALAAWNLTPDKGGKVTLKLAELSDRQFVRIFATNRNGSVVRDLSLPDAKTKLRNLTLRNGLDPAGHFTRQNQITILEKDAAFTIKDASTAEFAAQGSLGEIFELFRTLSRDPTLPEFSFILEWPKFDAAKKQAMYSKYACHELNFFLQRRDAAFFKSVVQPYLANKRDKTFLDHYLLGDDLHHYLRPWAYGRLNAMERILLAQRHPEEAAATAREMSELKALLPPNLEQEIFLFNSALQVGSLDALDGGSLGAARKLVQTASNAAALKRLPQGATITPNSIDGLISGNQAVVPPPAPAAAPADPFAPAQSPERVKNVEDVRRHLERAQSFMNRGDLDSASRAYQDALRIDRYNTAARRDMEKLEEQRGRFFWADHESTKVNIETADVSFWSRYYTDKMQRIIFPSVQFHNVTTEQAIEFLRLKSKELDTSERDPAKKGVNIILKVGTTPSTAQISLDLHDVPLLEALRYVTELAGMKYKVEPYAVVIVPISDVGNEQYTRSFKLPPDFLKKGGGTAREILQSAGISFPEGSGAEFNTGLSLLVVKNTQPNLDLVENFVQTLGGKAEGEAVAAGEGDLALRSDYSTQFYRKLDPTSEWAENNYYHLPIGQQLAGLVHVNGFWKDYAAWDGKSPFLSTHVAEASSSFAEMMFALAVLDLPFPSEAKEPKAEVKDLSLTITPSQRMILFHRELKPAQTDKAAPRLLVSQSFYRHGDRYIQQGGEKVDKFVSDEFLTGVVYGCQAVVTNPTSSTQKLDLLLQVPQGAIPVLGSRPTENRPLELEPYHTFTTDYFFYFPREGKFAHHPVHVSKAEKIVAFAPPFTFNVVNELTKLDTASWDYVSQFGKAEDVIDFLEQHNIHQLNLDRMAWRLHDAAFFKQVVALLLKHHVYHPTTWSYALLHNDATVLREFLQHADGFMADCGPALESKLVTIDPVLRYTYQHLEYSPLVNARAHQLGAVRTLLNENFYTQYDELLAVLSHRPTMGDEDRLAVSYYLLLQDRIEEALAVFASVDGAKITEHLQYDYMKAVTALYRGDAATARQIAQAQAKHPVDRWREKFAELLAQLGEIEGQKPDAVKPDSREQVQNRLASTEPTLDFKVENKEVKLTYKNVKEITVNYYPMDLEFLFSSAPFASQNSARFGMIRPNRSERVQLPAEGGAHHFALPRDYHSSNVLVEIVAAGKTLSHAYYANELDVQISESFGRLQVLHAADHRPLPRTYVKVFAEIGGESKFYKDGYTDLRGKFDYLSLSTGELDQASRFSILIVSDEFGAAVREVKPPRQ